MSHDHDHSVPHQHKARAPAYAKVYIITCSDSRTAANDEGGRILKSRLADKGHVIAGSTIVPDEPARILEELARAPADRKSTRLNSSHVSISYAVFCLK